jgi:monofunctional biosynthetic peptidoglycan transglycosylase
MKTLMKVVRIIWKVITGIFLSYAVLFSIVGTVLIIYLANYITKPIKEVKKFQTANPSQTLYMSKYKQCLREAGEPDTLSHIFVSLDSISPVLKRAVLAAEDDGFYTHPGFDLVAILKAFEHNKAHNSIKRGASTLTQQMAKNLFVGDRKKFERKYLELVYTILMERHLGKDRILELYLNYAQWGKYIFGCEAASQFYYNKSCKHLSVDQASRLAAVLAKPCRMNPNYMKSSYIQKRLRVIGDNMYRRHQIDDSTYVSLAGTDSLILLKKDTLADSIKSVPQADSIITKRRF